MRFLMLLFFIAAVHGPITAQSDTARLYSQAYGNPMAEPVVFLHGGPGYNSASFDWSTSQRLADAGYYVIVYDQRGNGRSAPSPNAAFTFEESCRDLAAILQRYNVNSVHLIGHSFGGTIATYFAETHPKQVRSLTFVGSPVSYQQMFRSILDHCATKLMAPADSGRHAYVETVRKMDTTSVFYASTVFQLAMMNGLYSPHQTTLERTALVKHLREHADAQLLSQSDFPPVMGFYKHEKYTLLELANRWRALRQRGVPVFGIYGADDGLFDEVQLTTIRQALGSDHVWLVDNASHSVFIDQQTEFLRLLNKSTGHH